jgi:hypothetical protein
MKEHEHETALLAWACLLAAAAVSNPAAGFSGAPESDYCTELVHSVFLCISTWTLTHLQSAVSPSSSNHKCQTNTLACHEVHHKNVQHRLADFWPLQFRPSSVTTHLERVGEPTMMMDELVPGSSL